MKKRLEPVSIGRGETLERVIFRGSRKSMSRRDLHVALEPIFRAWIRAACRWDSAELGDYKFVVFSLEVAPETSVYVQFWSEPLEPVLWEVSSGRWNPPADEWLRGERSRRIRSFGFAIGGKAKNFEREVTVATAADVAVIAKTVVKIFYSAFDYRGTAPIEAQLVHEGRSEMQPTFDAFTPEDMAKVFTGLGFRVEETATEATTGKQPTVLRCRKAATATIVEFHERVDDENLFRRATFSAELQSPQSDSNTLEEDASILALSVVHAFGGGVTVAWLVERIHEWDLMLRAHRSAVRRSKGPNSRHTGDTTLH